MAKLGLHSLAFSELWNPSVDGVKLARFAELGVQVIETPLLNIDQYDADGTRAVMIAHDMELICSLGLPKEVDPQIDFDGAAEYLSRAFDVAQRAGASALSGVTYGTIGVTSGKPRTEREVDNLVRLVTTVDGLATARGIRFGIEPCNRYETHLLNTAAQARNIIERAGAQSTFIHLDSYHMSIEERGFTRGFSDAGDQLGYLHLSESNRGTPGQGTLDWDGLFAGAKTVGYDGVMTVESFVYLAPEIASGLAVWRPVADDPMQVIEDGIPFLIEAAARAGIKLGR